MRSTIHYDGKPIRRACHLFTQSVVDLCGYSHLPAGFPEPLLTDDGMVWYWPLHRRIEEYRGDLDSCVYDWSMGSYHYSWNVAEADVNDTPFAALSMRNIEDRAKSASTQRPPQRAQG